MYVIISVIYYTINSSTKKLATFFQLIYKTSPHPTHSICANLGIYVIFFHFDQSIIEKISIHR